MHLVLQFDQIILSLLLVGEAFRLATSDFLDAFTVKSLVRLEALSSASSIENRSLEVEETYDRSRRLGKVVILDGSGERSELYVRLKDNLYLEAQFAANNSLINCEAMQEHSALGAFGLFKGMTGLVTLNLAGDNGYLIGPSALIYLYRKELRTRWQHNQQQQRPLSNGQEWEQLQFRRRLIVNPDPIEFFPNTPNGSEKAKVTFKQSDFLIERSPLLSELAPFVSYSTPSVLITIDILAIDEFEDPLRLFSNFKLPAGFACIAKGTRKRPTGAAFYLNETRGWSNLLNIGANRASMSIHSLESYPEGVFLALDMARHLFRFDTIGRSRNVVDIREQLIYHMPNEPAISADSEMDILDSATNQSSDSSNHNDKGLQQQDLIAIGPQVRNEQCTILTTGFRPPPTFKPDESPNSLSRWHFFLGTTNLMMYIGQVRYKNARLAHEFELLYESQFELPAFFMSLVWRGAWLKLKRLQKTDMLLGKVWISAESCPIESAASRFPICFNPQVLGYRVDLVQTDTMTVKQSEEVQLIGFEWNYREDGMADKPFEAFDIRTCPLEKLHLTLEVRWFDSLDVGNTLTICDHVDDLDSFISTELHRYLDDDFIRENLFILSLEKQSLPGVRIAKYRVELAEKPKVANRFFKSNKMVSKSQMEYNPIDQIMSRTSFECFGWASQFGNAIGLLYHTKTGECLVYESSIFRESDGLNVNQDELYELHSRTFENMTLNRSKGNAMQTFISQYLGSINKQIFDSNRMSNGRRACIGNAILVRDIRMGTLKIVPEQEIGVGFRSTSSSKSFLVKSGYRFLELATNESSSDTEISSRQQSEAVSFAQCLNKCKDEPKCASLSYCRYQDSGHELCQLSDLNLLKVASDATEKLDDRKWIEVVARNQLTRDAGCEIYAKNYLLYFEAQNAGELIGSVQQQDSYWHLAVEAFSELDCAQACYSQPGESCMNFLHCAKAKRKCLLRLLEANYNESHSQTRSLIPVHELGVGVEAMSPPEECSAFKRMSMSLYKRIMAGKSENFTSWIGDSLNESKVISVSKEECAEMCTYDVECQSFDTCLTTESQTSSSSSDIGGPFNCILFSGSILDTTTETIRMEPIASNRSVDDGQIINTSSHLEHCAHYERLDASKRLSASRVKSIMQKLRLGIQQNKANNWGLSRVLSIILAAIIGLTLGAFANFLFSLRSSRRFK